MKSTSVSTKIITILLLLAVIGYFAVQGYNYFVSPETTTLVYRYHSERSIALRGYVVRDEQVVDCNETLIELKLAEGEHGSLPYFEKVHALFVDINAKLYDNTLDILSMGMSGDYEDAVRAGATMVRVGTAIFGARNYTI